MKEISKKKYLLYDSIYKKLLQSIDYSKRIREVGAQGGGEGNILTCEGALRNVLGLCLCSISRS